MSSLIAATAAALTLAAATPPEGSLETGRREYRQNCAVCHGQDGHGEGPYAMYLKKAPADLTRLAEQNGGAFPFDRVRRVIDGRVQVMLHGPREMPVWGFEYNREARNRYSDIVGQEFVETFVARRILSLIRYLESIQGR